MERKICEDNYDDVCRVCLSYDDNNDFIFRDKNNEGSNIQDKYTLSQKIQIYGGIEILENDGLPNKICDICISKVNVAHDFRDQCQKADEKLRKLYGKTANGKNFTFLNGQKDQYSQTEISTFLGHVKEEKNMGIEIWGHKMGKKIGDNLESVEDLPEEEGTHELPHRIFFKQDNEMEDDKISPEFNVGQALEQTDKEKNFSKRESYRTRRVSMFKRMTSIQNLKSHKERQRQYIKKNTNPKIDSIIDQDLSSNKNPRIRSIETDLSYKCEECDRSYLTRRSLERHESTHEDENKKLKCDKCSKEFHREDKLIEHNKLHDNQSISCKICDKNFRKTDTMVRHLNIHKKANPKEVFKILKDIRDKRKRENEVENCVEKDDKDEKTAELSKEESSSGDETEMKDRRDKSLPISNNEDQDYNNLDSLNSESHESESETDSFNNLSFYKCKHCTKFYSTKKSLQRHMLIHDEKKFVCNVCNMKFYRADRLKSHKDRYGHDEYKEFSEPQKPPDDKSAIKLINSWIREELDSDNEGKGFPCEICGKSYVTKKSLQKHKSNMHDSGDHRDNCDSCKSENCECFENKTARENDKKIEKSKPYNCDECNKSFEKESKLEKHLRIHERAKEQEDSNFKRFLCHICSKTFRQNTGLMFHMRTHTGYKPHVCKYCGRGFTSNSNCINHERTHTGDRPFVCHFCSAAFAKSCTLKAHITTHTGEANYHCKTCGKSFRRLKYLKEHRFTHTGEKPYACKICGTAYSHSGSLFVHEKKCKAQYSNYNQTTTTSGSGQQDIQIYTQSQNNSVNTSSVIAPTIIPIISSSHTLSNINNSLGSNGNKNYVENMRTMSAHAHAHAAHAAAQAATAAAAAAVGNQTLHIHQNQDVSEMASAVRSFAIIGQIFHS